MADKKNKKNQGRAYEKCRLRLFFSLLSELLYECAQHNNCTEHMEEKNATAVSQ